MLREILTARTRPSDKMLYNIWARKISGGWAETTLTGTLPLAFLSEKAQTLTDYTVHGAAERVGVETENIFPFTKQAEVSFGNSATVISDGHGTMYVQGTISGEKTSGIIELEENITVPLSQGAGGEYVFYVGNFFQSASRLAILFLDDNNEEVDRWIFTTKNRSSATYVTLGGKTIHAVAFASISGASYSNINFSVQPMLVKTTGRNKYLPYGYQIPLTVESGEESTDYVLYIGDTKLGAAEYVDYSEQKIYKDVSGTLTPTDPPAPLPAITAYKGENTLSSTETVGNVSVTGKIKEVTP